MIAFRRTELSGALILESEPATDERGSLSRTYCKREFAAQGIDFAPLQASVSSNAKSGTLRGLHYQAPGRAEAKLVRCTRGSVYDVAVDVRPESPTYARWIAVELTATNSRSLFVPEGCAHGFQTLEDDTEVLYLISEFYEPDAQCGIRWDDPLLGIDWPDAPLRVISERDRSLPYLGELGRS